MKKTLLFLLLTFSSIQLFSQITIGDGTNESQSVPIEPYFGYSYTQSIYLSTEIQATGNITTLSYFYSGVSNLSNSDDDIQIWIAHSSKTSFSTTSDWEAVSGMTLVYDGSIPAPTTPGVDEWLEIDITDFLYNGVDNIIIAVDANEAGWNDVNDDFHCTSTSSARSIRYYNDSTNPDPAAPPTGTLVSYIPNIILGGIMQTCTSASGGSISSISDNSADITWVDGIGCVIGYTVSFSPPDDIGGLVMCGVQAYSATGLTSNTTYTATITSDCPGNPSYSFDFTTDASPPECPTLDGPADASTDVSIDPTLSWTASATGDPADDYTIYLGDSPGNLTDVGNVSTTTFDLSDLDYLTTYYWQIVPTNSGGEPTGCDIYSFTTENCSAVATPHLEDFNAATSLPADWSGDFLVSSSHGQTGNGAYRNMYSFTTTANLNSLFVGPVAAGDELKFSTRVLNFSGFPTGGPPADGYGTLDVAISSDCGATFTSVGTYGNDINTGDWEEQTIDISSYIGQNIQVVFISTWTTGDYYMEIDDFFVGPPPSTVLCAVNLMPADGTTDIAIECGMSDITFTWDANGAGLTPDEYWFQVGSDPQALVTNTTTETTYTFPDFVAGQTYYYRVVPRLNNESAMDCPTLSFTTGINNDAGSGGSSEVYYFANNNNGDGTAGDGFVWDDPVGLGHTEVTAVTTGSFDDGFVTIPLPFSFTYYGVEYTEIHMGTNGYASFGSGYTTAAGSTTLGSTSSPDNMIAIAMMDLDDRTNGKLYYGPIDAVSYALTWYHMHDYGDENEYITMQLILQDLSGTDNDPFELRYNEAETSATYSDILSDAVIGCESGNATATTEYASYRENGVGGPLFCSPLVIGFSATENGVSLPLELLSFQGIAMDKGNKITWKTANEINTLGFTVEKMYNGNTWRAIGELQAAGNSTAELSYSFMDENPSSKELYRLKSMDIDGQYTYSEIIEVRRKGTSNEVDVYPNPFSEVINVELNLMTPQISTITVYDVTGKMIYQQEQSMAQGENSMLVDMNQHNAGVYIISVQLGNEIIQKRVIKQ